MIALLSYFIGLTAGQLFPILSVLIIISAKFYRINVSILIFLLLGIYSYFPLDLKKEINNNYFEVNSKVRYSSFSQDQIQLRSLDNNKIYQCYYKKTPQKEYYLKKGDIISANIRITKACKIDLINSYYSNNYSTYNFIVRLKKILNKYLAESNSYYLVSSILLGDKEIIPDNIHQLFKSSGLLHVMSISGYHLGVFFFFNLLIFSFFGKDKAVLLSLIITFMYLVLIDYPNSAVRSYISLTLIVITYFFGLKYNFSKIILTSLIILSVINPLTILKVGTQLTYCALFSISLGLKFKNKIIKYIMINLFIYISTSLITYIYFDYISLYGFIFNLIFTPFLMFIFFKLSIIGLLLDLISTDISKYVFDLIKLFADYFIEILNLILS